MLALEQALAAQLKQLRVHTDVPDGNTVFFRNVPANERFFNKPCTNLLLKRPQEGLPFLVCVDENLEYTGPDASLARAFASGLRHHGWHVLCLQHQAAGDFPQVLSSALRALGFDGAEPSLEAAAPSSPRAPLRGVLARVGTDLSTAVREGRAEPTIGRTEQIEEALSCLLACQVRLPLILGCPGMGKTNLLFGVARKCGLCRPEWRLVSVDLGVLLAGALYDAERENLIASLLNEATTPGIVVAIEHLELALLEASHGALLLNQALEKGGRLIGTTSPGYWDLFEAAAPLARHVHAIELSELDPASTLEVLFARRQQLARHHALTIDDALVHAAVGRAKSVAGCFPAKALALLDAAATRAALAGETNVSLYDLYLAATSFREGVEPRGHDLMAL